MKKILLIIAGYVSLSLGVVGIFVPLLPTTPFILLAAACFLRSSDSLYHWITHHRIFGAYITNYLRHGAISRTAKFFLIAFLWLSIGLSAIFFTTSTGIRILLLSIAAGVTFHIYSLNTLTGDGSCKNDDKVR